MFNFFKTRKTNSPKTRKIKCVLPKNEILFKCSKSLTNIWKNEFKGKYKIKKTKLVHDIEFMLNKKVAILRTDLDMSITYLIFKGKKLRANLETEDGYEILKRIKRLLGS
jgi:hypothetical protein